jgi:hypothetical protein
MIWLYRTLLIVRMLLYHLIFIKMKLEKKTIRFTFTLVIPLIVNFAMCYLLMSYWRDGLYILYFLSLLFLVLPMSFTWKYCATVTALYVPLSPIIYCAFHYIDVQNCIVAHLIPFAEIGYPGYPIGIITVLLLLYLRVLVKSIIT